MEKVNSSTNLSGLVQGDIESLESHLLFLNVDEAYSPEQRQDGRIQQKIDVNSVDMIKWNKVEQLIQDTINQFKFCFYELRIYNAETLNESTTIVLKKIKEIGLELNLNGTITKVKQGLYGIFFEFFFQPFLSSSNKNLEQKKFNEVKIGAFGDENSGKSTTLSVLINEKLDDGKGLMRVKNFRFQHEIQSGKTLSVSHLVMGFDEQGNRVHIDDTLTDEQKKIKLNSSSKLINLYDMGGSEKAMKLTLSLISPNYIDYALLFIDPTQGFTEITQRFYSLNNSIHIPIIAILTKVDLVSEKIINFVKEQFVQFANKQIPYHFPVYIKSEQDIKDYFNNGSNNPAIPFIEVSNLSGIGLSLLEKLLSSLENTVTKTIPLLNNSFEQDYFSFSSSPRCQFDIHEHFVIEGTKTIIGGVVSKGKIVKGEQYYFGPNKLGNFKLVVVDSIHCKKQNVDVAYEGQFSSLCLKGKNFNPNELRKGMCLTGTAIAPQSVRKFKADMWNIGNEGMKEVKFKYEPVVIIDHIRHNCKIIRENFVPDSGMINRVDSQSNSEFTESTSRITDKEEFSDDGRRSKKKRHPIGSRHIDDTFFISNQEKIELTFEFKNYPEYIIEGANVIINDKNLKALGIVTKVFY